MPAVIEQARVDEVDATIQHERAVVISTKFDGLGVRGWPSGVGAPFDGSWLRWSARRLVVLGMYSTALQGGHVVSLSLMPPVAFAAL